MNFEKAVAFVRSKGNQVEQARRQYLLANQHPSQATVAQRFTTGRPVTVLGVLG